MHLALLIILWINIFHLIVLNLTKKLITIIYNILMINNYESLKFQNEYIDKLANLQNLNKFEVSVSKNFKKI